MEMKEIFMILIISIILFFIIGSDMADEDLMDNTITSNISEKINISNSSNVICFDEDGNRITHNNTITVNPSDRLHKVSTKPQKPTITITAKPSCGCRYSYSWRTNTFINYCPHCHKYGTLKNVHKWQARYEQELTCTYCGADYCGQCGKEKYSWSRYYLTKC